MLQFQNIVVACSPRIVKDWSRQWFEEVVKEIDQRIGQTNRSNATNASLGKI